VNILAWLGAGELSSERNTRSICSFFFPRHGVPRHGGSEHISYRCHCYTEK